MELPGTERHRAQILQRSPPREISLYHRVRRRDSTRASMGLSAHHRFPSRPHHYLAAEKLNAVVTGKQLGCCCKKRQLQVADSTPGTAAARICAKSGSAADSAVTLKSNKSPRTSSL